ncbi:reactive intermediate/imine deaminase [Actinacidiphila rubida]|uniref:Reactive intermediate/imine deaminase n=2 Tax=Actinacidiphila rubida TaxID=310780 RepID=A0A1H8HI93_9ACTN|nr:RidA family protein [Actinacidiphila rubida]SEN55890.1 reactive intermediate/imine deaminase [Actinacidiphila rubida]
MSELPEHNPAQLPHLPKTAITPAGASAPPARFSHGVRKGNILQVAGQVGFLPADGSGERKLSGPSLAEQTRTTFANVQAVLEAGGASWEDVLMIRVYLTDTAHFAEFNELWNAFFEGLKEAPAARTTVYVGLPAGILVEIDALAVLG